MPRKTASTILKPLLENAQLINKLSLLMFRELEVTEPQENVLCTRPQMHFRNRRGNIRLPRNQRLLKVAANIEVSFVAELIKEREGIMLIRLPTTLWASSVPSPSLFLPSPFPFYLLNFVFFLLPFHLPCILLFFHFAFHQLLGIFFSFKFFHFFILPSSPVLFFTPFSFPL